MSIFQRSQGVTDGMDYFKGMQCVDGPVCSRNHAEGKISELGIVKKWFDLDVTKGVKLLASLPLARWKMHSFVAMSMGIHNKL